jgi:hypothetical protein
MKLIASAIKGFNREWAAVTANRDRNGDITGWTLVTECNLTGRSFLNRHWEDPHGAAMKALETHRCEPGKNHHANT